MKLYKYGLMTALLAIGFNAYADLTPLRPPSDPVQAERPVMLERNLSLALARQLVDDAVAICVANNFPVTATVVDRAGTVLAVARDSRAGPLTLASSERKAYTAASFRTPTGDLMERSRQFPNAANLVHIPGTLLLAGGVPIRSGNTVIGAIGVGGAPDGRIDVQCIDYALAKAAPLLR
jgi:uncharacterized protein GlcG (DUF336 family)